MTRGPFGRISAPEPQVRGAKGKFDYGFLPPALLNLLLRRFVEIWRGGQGKAVQRD